MVTADESVARSGWLVIAAHRTRWLAGDRDVRDGAALPVRAQTTRVLRRRLAMIPTHSVVPASRLGEIGELSDL